MANSSRQEHQPWTMAMSMEGMENLCTHRLAWQKGGWFSHADDGDGGAWIME
jgi:hypothetical protein